MVYTANEALRKVPDIHMRDREITGLRPDVGIRGLNHICSTRINLLEDGIPLSSAAISMQSAVAAIISTAS
ncbi:MAG: hypothetical protein KF888_01245 [Nitrosomonas sp.]|nr:hypothetical protein [Nitrosomonas sp.]